MFQNGIVDFQHRPSFAFCTEKCERGPVLKVNNTVLEHCTIEKAIEEINQVMVST
jgi:NADH:ubiquinone oxidoreductase subunit E